MDPNYEREIIAKSAKRILVIFAVCTLLILLVLLLSSCKTPAQAILPEGKILERNGDRYLVVWPDHGDKPHTYAWNWVYQPGLGWMEIEDMEVLIVIRKKGGEDEK